MLVTKIKGALRLAAVSQDALALGLGPGLTLADARARVPSLLVRTHDPARDMQQLEAIADWCDRYTPLVACDLPDGLMLDLTGCCHSFGGEAALVADLVARIGARGLSVDHALAATPDRARALARFALPLPVAALELEPRATLALNRAGLKLIDDLACRPRAPLAARFGQTMIDKLMRLLGEDDVHITPRRAPPALFVIRRFAEPVARTPYILAMLEQLVGEAAHALEARGLGGRSFAADLFRSDGAVHHLTIATGTPLRDPLRVMRLFAERIDALADPLDPGFGYDLIRLAVPHAEPLAVAQLELDRRPAPAGELAALIDRLGVRLGPARIRRLAPGASHIPEQAVFGFAASEPAIPWPVAEPGEPARRPLHLFDPPQRIEVIAEVPDGPPRRFRWRRLTHDVLRYEGPERIAAEWWKRRDARGLTRDYYRVEDAAGRRFWLFRHGLYGDEKPNPDWYLHGLFA